MALKSVICLHGYGVRGFFWEPVRPLLQEAFPEVLTPNLKLQNTRTLLDHAEEIVHGKSKLDRGPVVLIGHSLGGVAAAMCARHLGSRVVSKVVILAAPYGEQERVPGTVTRFLLRHQLIPNVLIRSRFFTAKTAPEDQRRIFDHAVRESKELQDEIFERRWFHTDYFPPPLEQPSLVVASAYDKTVPMQQTLQFADALDAERIVLDYSRKVAHNDMIWAPEVRRSLFPDIVGFLKRSGGRQQRPQT